MACKEAAVAYGTPFISGKDSLNNEYRVGGETRSIPPTLLISALAIVPDVARITLGVTISKPTVKAVRDALGPLPLVAPELGVVVDADPTTARATARSHLNGYLALENYVNSWRSLGFDDADFAGGGSDRLVDALVAWGDVGAVRARVEEHLAAGADHVAVQPLTVDRRFPSRELAELAPALLS
jgi:hypothetical protein